MMPLTLAGIGEENTIKKVGGSPEVKKHLENLGITAGAEIEVISGSGGSIICKVKDGRLALDKNLSTKILVA